MGRQTMVSGYLKGLLKAVRGQAPEAVSKETLQPADTESVALCAQVAALEMDLRERDERIEKMQAEYDALKIGGERKAASAGRGELEALFKKLSGPLSNLAALASLSEAGREVSVRDLLGLFRSLEKALALAGMEGVGKAGEWVVFDSSVHQRMSGGTVRSGMRVKVRVPGYRTGEKVLMKAMVTSEEDES